jgi:PAS domain S-box-containing protein
VTDEGDDGRVDPASSETPAGRGPGAKSVAEDQINRRIFETSPDLILVVDRQGTFIRVSPSSISILGYRPDEMVGRSAMEFLYPEDLDNTRNEMRLARRGQVTGNFECRYVHKEGRVVTLSWTGVWAEPEQQFFFIGRDVTEQKKLEQALREAQQRDALIREAIDSLPEGFAIYDENDRLAIFNKAYAQLFPENAASIAPGLGYEDVLQDGLRRGIYPDAKGRAENWIEERLRQHREHEGTIEQRLSDDRWVLVSKHRLSNDWTAGLRIDITRLKRAEQALRDSERRFQDIAEVSGDWIWETDREHRFTVLTGERTATLPVQPAGLFGKTRWDVAGADPTTDEHWGRHKADLEAHRAFRQLRYAVTAPTGEQLYISASGKPVFDDAQNFLGYRGTATDETDIVTARHEAERAEALLRDAIESFSEGFAIYDGKDQLVVFNRAYVQLFPDNAAPLGPGDRFEEVLRRNLARGIYPDVRDREEEWVQQQLDLHHQGNGTVEHRLSDGRWVLVSKHRMSNGWTASLRIDITLLKAAEESLRESEQAARGIVQSALDAVIQMDEAGNVVEWNSQAESIFGWPREEAVGRSLSSLIVPPIYRQRHRAGLARFLATGNGTVIGRRFEIEALRRDGRKIEVELAITALRRRSGYVFNGFIRDLTQQKTIEAQLRQSQKIEAIGNLTGGMAHDFNNLLGIIIGNLDLLRDREIADPEADELTNEALEAALRGADLTRGLLAFARRQPLQPERTDLNGLVVRITNLLKRTLGEQIQITLELDPDTWAVVVDPAQLEATLTNLATNARDAMPRGGQLIIVTGNRSLDADYALQHTEVQPGDYALLEVSDTGTGMPPEVASQIFEPFYTTKEQGKGTGLGLSMVFGFMKQSGGHTNVYSEVGIGTTFRLYLPRADAEADAGRATTERELQRGSGETVLAVEDNASLRRVVARQLTDLGYRVLEAEDPQSALHILASEKVDVLFTDIVMPGGTSGYDLARTVLSRWPEMKLVLTSGFPDNRINGDGRLPNLRLLSKPYRREELGRILRDALDP